MKLKTLENLKPLIFIHGNEEAIVHLIKKEAIKWVLDIRNSTPSTSQKKEDIRCFSESWIKNFFNIIEDDLK